MRFCRGAWPLPSKEQWEKILPVRCFFASFLFPIDFGDFTWESVQKTNDLTLLLTQDEFRSPFPEEGGDLTCSPHGPLNWADACDGWNLLAPGKSVCSGFLDAQEGRGGTGPLELQGTWIALGTQPKRKLWHRMGAACWQLLGLS